MKFRHPHIRRRRNVRFGRQRRFSKFLIVLLVMLIAFSFLMLYFSTKLSPIVKSIAMARVEYIATNAISEAIGEELQESGFQYSDIMTLEKDKDNHVTALRTNIVKVNELKSVLSVRILNKITKINSSELAIPLGNIFGSEVFSGRGPKVKIKIIPVGAVYSDITNIFTSAGINQTRHQIMMNIDIKMGIIIPTGNTSTDVKTSVCIAETVIVGSVPDSYANVETGVQDPMNYLNDYWNNSTGTGTGVNNAVTNPGK